MARQSIPADVKKQVEAIVDRFNREVIRRPSEFFVLRYRGIYIYLDRGVGRAVQRGRIEYTGAMDEWDFAIFKYSTDSYDPDEWMFPGSEYLDGTVEGALKACVEAYP